MEITESISEVFTPHELNYQNLGLINFEKDVLPAKKSLRGCITEEKIEI